MTTIIVDGDNQDKILIQRNTDSFSIDAGKSMETIQDTDYILVQRGEESYRVSGAIAKDDLGTKGEIQEPVAVISPEDGAGMSDEDVYPAAEGITGLVESTVIAPTYSSTLTVEVGNADGGTTAVNAFDGDTAKEFRGTIASTMVWDASSYGITVANSLKIHTLSLKGSGDSNVAISINGAVLHNTNTSDQNTNYGTAGTVNIPFTGDLNEVRFVATGSAGTYFYAIYVDDEVLIDGGVTNNATLTYTTDNNLNLLTVGQAMTQQPAYTPVTDTITSITTFPSNPSITYADAGADYQTGFVDKTSANFQYTWNQGEYKTDGIYVIIDKGAGNEYASLRLTPAGSQAVASGSNDLKNWVQIQGISNTDHGFLGYRYIWPQSTLSAYGGGVTYTSMAVDSKELEFNSPKDIVNFRPGDIVQVNGTGNPLWNETKFWNAYTTTNGNWLEETFTSDRAFNGDDMQAAEVIPAGENIYILIDNLGFTGSNAVSIKGLWRSIEINGDAYPGLVNNTYIDLTINNLNSIKLYGSDSGPASGPILYQVKVDGLILVNPSEINKVVSTDADNSKMTVDGGKWDASNQSEVWSESVTLGSGNIYSDGGGVDKTPDRIFDGDDTTDCVVEKGTASSAVSLELSTPILNVTKIRVKFSSVNTFYINNSTQYTATVASGWETIYEGASFNLNTFKIERTSNVSSGDSTTGFSVSAIEINNQILIDEVNDSQVWSANVTNASASGGYEYDHVFDGDNTTYYTRNNTGNSVSTFTGFDSITSLTILGSTYSSGVAGGGSIIVNQGEADEVDITSQIPLGANPATGAAVETAITGVSSLKTLTINGTTSGKGSFIAGIKVDGKLLVDPGARNLGDTEVTGPLCQGTGKYVSKDATTLELTNVGDRWCVDDQNVGLAAVSDTEYTVLAPDPNEIVFQSANGEPLTTTFSAENCVLREITWTLGVSETGEAGTYVETEYEQSVAVPINIEVPPWAGPPDGLANDTYYSLKAKYEADSRAEAVESNTIYFKTGSGNEPQVQMSGLRFDPARGTLMKRSQNHRNSDDHTISFWVKPASTNFTYVYSSDDGENYVGYDANRIIYSSGSNATTVSYSLTLNKWTHIVLSSSGSSVKFYVDGNLLGTQNDYNSFAGNGKWTLGASMNGYLSDFYLVDGQVLGSSDFGDDYDGLWGPISSETVLNNITRNESPYDQRPNMDEKWSDDLTADDFTAGDKINAFDGNPDTGAQSSTGNGTMIFNKVFDDVNRLQIQTRKTSSSNPSVISGNGIETTVISAEDSIRLIDIPLTDTTISEITITATNAAAPGIARIAINSQILVDGPADNSQNWSSYCTWTFNVPNQGAEKAFDGDVSKAWYTDVTSWQKFEIPGGIDATKFEIYITGGSNYGNFRVNGSNALSKVSGASEVWVDMSEFIEDGKINLVEGYRSSGSPGIGGFKVDDVILIDSGAQWDTSEIWSVHAVFGNNNGAIARPLSDSFNGDITNAATMGNDGPNSDPTAGKVYWNPSGGFNFTDKVEVYVGNSLRNLFYSYNSGAETALPSSEGWTTIASGGGTINQIYTSRGSTNGAVFFSAVRVDGKILVDTGSFGDNGFYLPFDPAQEGVNYSQYITGDLGAPTSSYTDGFDGSLISSVIGLSGLTYTIPPGVEGTLEIHTSPASQTITLNGTQVVASSTSGWNTIGTVSEGDVIVLTGGASGDGCFEAMKIDDKWLLDHNSIGVDASGNGNNFHDENFAVGNTSQVWSNTITITNGSADNNNINQNAFDGVLNSSSFMTCANNGGGAVATFTFNPPIGNGVDDVVEVAWYRVGAVSVTPQVNGKDENSVTEGKWFNAGSQLVSLGLSHSEGFGANGIYGIRLNGQLLIDANIQDTVVDTPIKNYAVHTGAGASNGNLVQTNVTNANAKSTSVTFAADSKIYFESFMQNGSDYHIGVTNGSGTVSIVRNDGTLTAATLSSGTAITWAQGDTIGVTIDVANKTMTLQKTGSPGGDIATYTLNNCAAGYSPLVSTGAGVQVNNFGQQPFVYTPPAGYDGLYQLFEDWQKGGAYFYDENNQEVVRATHLRHRYGRDTADNRLGIYDLTEQPSHQVIGYEKVGDKYQPLRDYTPEVRTAQAETAVAEAQADKYLSFLKSAATAWAVGKIYNEGGIIEFNGKLYRALTDATSTADNDPADDTADWEDLGINS